MTLPTLNGIQTGNSAILYYELFWDAGSTGTTWSSYTVTSTNTISITGLSSGQSYQFKYKA